MELPHWIREPSVFLRFLLPGFLFFAFASAFFPRLLDGATRAVSVAASRSDLTLVIWFSWVVAIGLVFHIFWRFVYFVIRPRPHPSDLIGRLLERAGAPPPKAFERRALYEVLIARAGDEAAARALARERALVQSSYQATLVLVLSGAFLAVSHRPSTLVSEELGLVEGIVFVGAGAGLMFWVRLRDAVLHRMELSLVKWGEPETLAALEATWANLWSARHGLPQPPASLPPPSRP